MGIETTQVTKPMLSRPNPKTLHPPKSSELWIEKVGYMCQNVPWKPSSCMSVSLPVCVRAWVSPHMTCSVFPWVTHYLQHSLQKLIGIPQRAAQKKKKEKRERETGSQTSLPFQQQKNTVWFCWAGWGLFYRRQPIGATAWLHSVWAKKMTEWDPQRLLLNWLSPGGIMHILSTATSWPALFWYSYVFTVFIWVMIKTCYFTGGFLCLKLISLWGDLAENSTLLHMIQLRCMCCSVHLASLGRSNSSVTALLIKWFWVKHELYLSS